jgi:hypothetical protein
MIRVAETDFQDSESETLTLNLNNAADPSHSGWHRDRRAVTPAAPARAAAAAGGGGHGHGDDCSSFH